MHVGVRVFPRNAGRARDVVVGGSVAAGRRRTLRTGGPLPRGLVCRIRRREVRRVGAHAKVPWTVVSVPTVLYGQFQCARFHAHGVPQPCTGLGVCTGLCDQVVAVVSL
jgi:hypothetical protein